MMSTTGAADLDSYLVGHDDSGRDDDRGARVLIDRLVGVVVSTLPEHHSMRIVEVIAGRSVVIGLLGDMREWLDRNACRDVRFETEKNGITVTIKAHFEHDELAERFRRAFRGS
jgi:hypothetical protein